MFMKVFSKTYDKRSPYPDIYDEKTVRKADILDSYVQKILKDLKERTNSYDNNILEFVINFYLPVLAFQMVELNVFFISNENFENINIVLNKDYFSRFFDPDEIEIISDVFDSKSYKPLTIGIKQFAILIKSNGYSFVHQIWRDFFAAKHIINCMNAEKFDDLEISVDKSIRQFVGELVREYDVEKPNIRKCECDFAEKDNLETWSESPIEHFLQQHNMNSTKPISPIAIRNLIEIMKSCRNNHITADYSDLNLINTNFSECYISNSKFFNSAFLPFNNIYLDNGTNIKRKNDTDIFFITTRTKIYRYVFKVNELKLIFDLKNAYNLNQGWIIDFKIYNDYLLIKFSPSLFSEKNHIYILDTKYNMLCSCLLSNNALGSCDSPISIYKKYCAWVEDQDIVIYDIENDQRKKILKANMKLFSMKEIVVLDFINNEKIIYGSIDEIVIFNYKTDEVLFTINNGYDVFYPYYIYNNISNIITPTGIFELDEFKKIKNLDFKDKNIDKICISNDELKILSRDNYHRQTYLYNLKSLKEFKLSYRNCEFTCNGNLVLLNDNDSLSYFDFKTYCEHDLLNPQFGVFRPNSIKLYNDGFIVLNRIICRYVKLFNLNQSFLLNMTSDLLNKMSYDYRFYILNGNIVKSFENNRFISRLDMSFLRGYIQKTICSPSEYICASLIGEGTKQLFVVWDMLTGNIINSVQISNICFNIKFSRNGKYIIGVLNQGIFKYDLLKKSFLIKNIDIVDTYADISNDGNLMLYKELNYICFFDLERDKKMQMFYKSVVRKVVYFDYNNIIIVTKKGVDIFNIKKRKIICRYDYFINADINNSEFYNLQTPDGNELKELYRVLFQNGGIVPKEFEPKTIPFEWNDEKLNDKESE